MPVASQVCSHSYLPVQSVALRDKKAVGEQVLLCQICDKSGDGIVQCSGPCHGMYHTACTGHCSHDGVFLCGECYTGYPHIAVFLLVMTFLCD